MSSTLTASTLQSDILVLCKSQLIDLVLSENTDTYHCVNINILEWLDWRPEIIELYIQPQQYLTMLDFACIEAQKQLMQGTVKEKVHVRLVGTLAIPEFMRTKVPKADDVGRIITFSGTVTRTGQMKLCEIKQLYNCKKCNAPIWKYADRSQYNLIETPTACPGDSQESCNGTKFNKAEFTENTMAGNCRDYQEIRVQEQVSKLQVGNVPRSITVILEDDLVDSCRPGDDVVVTATVIQRWKKLRDSEKCEIQLALVANSIEQGKAKSSNILDFNGFFRDFWRQHNNSKIKGRNLILESFCPQINGMYLVKLAVMLILVGGVAKEQNGTRIRGDSHILLVGDPGTGKSKFLRYASLLAERSIFTTGIGSTNAGLTVTAVKDSGEWMLEAGALVLSDRGICCIDEFGSIRESDKTAIHEAMEQQSISVAKAGLVCKLDTRCSVLAAVNPKGPYDQKEALDVNIALGSPLLSRFDLILLLMDTHNSEWEDNLSKFILDQEMGISESNSNELFSFDQIRAYLTFVKSNFKPKLSESANILLKTYYQMQRSRDITNMMRTTIRLLESLIRLAESHARLCASDEVGVIDAVASIYLMESSMHSAALIGVPSILHTYFPENPEQDFNEIKMLILTKLGLEHLNEDSTIGQATTNSNDSEPAISSPGSTVSWEPTQQLPQSLCDDSNSNIDVELGILGESGEISRPISTKSSLGLDQYRFQKR